MLGEPQFQVKNRLSGPDNFYLDGASCPTRYYWQDAQPERRRARAADGKPVVLSRDILPGRLVARQPEIADEMLKRSIYEVLERDLGIVIHHGVASFRPVRADVTVARRLGIARGELLLAIWQVDYSEDGVPVLSSYEYHLADAFEFTVLRRGPGRRLS